MIALRSCRLCRGGLGIDTGSPHGERAMTGLAPPSLEGADVVPEAPTAQVARRRRSIANRLRTAARIVTRAGIRNSELGRLGVALAIGIAVAGAVILLRELVLQLQHL